MRKSTKVFMSLALSLAMLVAPMAGLELTKVEAAAPLAAGTADYAKTAVVTTSSNESAEYTGDKAVDNDMSSRWSSAFADNQWIQFDLGKVKNVGTIRIDWEAAYASEYDILWSNDGVTYTKAITQKRSAAGEATHMFNRPARFIKIVGVKRATSYGISIFNVQIIGEAEVETTTPEPTTTAPEKMEVQNFYVFGGMNLLSVSWRPGANHEACNVTYNVYVNGILVKANTKDTYYSDDAIGSGNHSVTVKSVYNGVETTGVYTGVYVKGEWVVQPKTTTEAPTTTTTTEAPTTTTVASNYIAVPNSNNLFYKKVDGLNIVNVQQPGFAAESGIYMTVPSAITSVSVNGNSSNVAAIQGAGTVVYVSAFTKEYNTVEIKYATGTITLEVKNTKVVPTTTQVPTTTRQPETQKTITMDLTFLAKATASSVENDDYTANKATDNNANTRWSSAWNDGEWIMFELDKVRTIRSLEIKWEAAYASNFSIYVSTNGIDFNKVGDYSGTPSGAQTIVFNYGRQAKYIKLVGDKRATQYGISIYDVKITGDMNVTPYNPY